MSLKSFFEPSSVAVIGASREPGKLGHEVFKNIIDAGYKGKIYPINPKAPDVLGVKCYPSIKDVPEEVELAVIIVPARFVPSVISDCGGKGVKAAVVISGGFGETGPAGAELERQLVEAARKAGIRVVGPNCQGVNSTSAGLCASWPLVKTKGPISVISQSGTVLAAIACWAEEEKVGVDKIVALGNKCDVDETELLDYFSNEPTTKVIALYIEGVRDGRKFFRVARAAAEKKPIVVLKSGKTAKGAKAVASHTRSLAGKDAIFDSVFKQVGIQRASSVEELYDFCKAFAGLPTPSGNNVAIITSSGGSGILALDASEELGMNVPDLPAEVRERLKEKLPPECILRNPLDLTGSATAQMYDETLNILNESGEIDAFVVIVGDPMPGISEVISKHVSRGRTIVPVMLGGGKAEAEEKTKLANAGIPLYSDPIRGVRALAACVRRAQWLASSNKFGNV
ncbi:MAG: acetate--CoA ligase family protein [Candidatus Hadarchaeum sp.]|uniref:acetate--CoA ligase family protein n=1 Tax=Candidatus Hadarchaeum sp. TaxID=2883567 RepID=UPI003D0ACA45